MCKFIFSLLLIIAASSSFGEVVRYTLVVKKTPFSVDGKSYKKITVNGQIPAPELVFTEGDTAHITVINEMDDIASVHWHGLLLPNKFDGVPYINQLPIKPGERKVYEFPLIQKGTYWYHSHVMFQEQDGLYGAFIIMPKKKRNLEYDVEKTVVLSDFHHDDGVTIHRNLKKDGHYYQIKRNYVQSWLKAFQTNTAWPKFYNSLQRMEGMDYADVAYDAFLANGQPTLPLLEFNTSYKKVKLRIVNGSATSIFKLTYGNGPITVVGNDGTDIEPVEVDILPIGTAETYDIILNIDPTKKIQLKATSLDNSGSANLLIGDGELVLAPQMPWKVPMGMDMGEMMGMPQMSYWKGLKMSYQNEFSDIPRSIKVKESDYSLPSDKKIKHKMHAHHMDAPMGEFTYDMAVATEPFEVKENQKLLTYHFTLNGNMENYVWSINGVPVGPETYIKIKKGYRVRFVMKNTTMMNHPMHLHGHFFRVLTANGYYSPKKHTVLVGPLATETIEFEATEEKDWFFHCHLLYHMMDGMARIVRYEDQPGEKYLTEARKKSHEFNYTKEFFLSTKALLHSNFSRLEGKYFNSFYMLEYDLESDYEGNSEYEIHLSRVLTRFFTFYLGAKTESEEYSYKGTPTVGVTWVLPLNIEFDLKYQLNQQMDQWEIEFENSIQLTSRAQLNLEYSSTRDWFTEIEYRHNKHFSTAVNYHGLYKSWGVGIGLTY